MTPGTGLFPSASLFPEAGPQTIAVGQAVESDSAPGIAERIAVAQAGEVDTANGIAVERPRLADDPVVVAAWAVDSATIDLTGRGVQDGDVLVTTAVSAGISAGSVAGMKRVMQNNMPWNSVNSQLSTFVKVWRTGDSLTYTISSGPTGQMNILVRGCDPYSPFHQASAATNANGTGPSSGPALDPVCPSKVLAVVCASKATDFESSMPGGMTEQARITSGRRGLVATKIVQHTEAFAPGAFTSAQGTIIYQVHLLPKRVQKIQPRSLAIQTGATNTLDPTLVATLSDAPRVGEEVFLATGAALANYGVTPTDHIVTDSKSGTWTLRVRNRNTAWWERTAGAALAAGDTVSCQFQFQGNIYGSSGFIQVIAVATGGTLKVGGQQITSDIFGGQVGADASGTWPANKTTVAYLFACDKLHSSLGTNIAYTLTHHTSLNDSNGHVGYAVRTDNTTAGTPGFTGFYGSSVGMANAILAFEEDPTFLEPLGQAIETDTAREVARRPVRGQAVETDTARPITHVVDPYYEEVASDSPTQWWRFDEVAGTVAAEEIAAAHIGTIVGSPGLGGRPLLNNGGTCIHCEGIDDEITLPGPTMPGTGSMELWFTWSGGIAIMRDHTSGIGAGWIFGFDDSGTFAVRLNSSTRLTTLATTAVRDGRPHHLVVTWAPASAPVIYLDGVNITSTVTSISPSGGTVPWHLMRNGSTSNQFTRGRVDELAFYNTVLSGARVTAHYNAGVLPAAGAPTSYADAVLDKLPMNYYHLDETAGTVADDSAVATGSDGTYVGSPTLNQTGLVRGGGKAVAFDGSNDDLTVIDVVSVTGSFELWFKWTAGVAIARQHSSTGGTIFGFDNSGTFAVSGAGVQKNTSLATTAVRDGLLHHLVVTWIPGTGGGKVYLDSVDITNGTWTPGGPTELSPLHIMRNGSNSQWSTGTVDEVAIYGHALSAANVLENYTIGKTQFIEVGQASETDTATVVTPSLGGGGDQTIAVAQALETDTAGAVTSPLIGQPSEIDTAGGVTRLILGQPSEIDTAQPIFSGRVVQASETDTAERLAQVVAIGQAVETDEALPIVAYLLRLVGQVEELDEAFPVIQRLIYVALETDLAIEVRPFAISLAVEIDTAQLVALYQYLYPLPAGGEPTFVFDPELIPGQVSLPGVGPIGSPSVANPTLIPGSPLNPNTGPAGAPNVFSPRLDPGQGLYQDTPSAEPASTVFGPVLIPGQFLHPGPGSDEPDAVVFNPTLRHGQPLRPDHLLATLTPTFYGPTLQHGQPLLPGIGPIGTIVVYDPVLAPGQELRPDLTDDPLLPLVFEPALMMREPSVIVSDDAAQERYSLIRPAY